MDAVLNWVWQGIAVAASLSLMLRATTRVRASVRYVVCGAALVIVLAIPAVSSLSSTPVVREYAAQSSTHPLIPVPATPWTSVAAMLGLGLLWAGAQGFSVCRALIRLHRARQAARPFPIDIERQLHHWLRVRGEQRRARLALSDDVGRAAVLGCGAPIIAISPALIERLSIDELDYVIIHEWAHVQRRDDIANLLQVAVRLVAGWHPAVWWIERRLHIEREVACDDTAVAIAGSRKSYANTLVKLSDSSTVRAVSLMATGVLGTGSLRYRVTKILSNGPLPSPMWSRSLGTASVAALLAVVLGIGGLELFATVTIAQPVTTTTLSAPAQTTLPRPLNVEPVAKAQGTRGRVASTRRHDAEGVPLLPSRTIDVPHESGNQHVQVETQTAVAVDALMFDAAASTSPTIASPDHDPQANARSPWLEAGEAGIAIGQRSKAAGVATGAAFTRFARHIAGSF